MKKFVNLFGGRKYALAVLVVCILGAFLRLYKLPQFTTFLGDQGRDAIVMKDIITFKDFTALGPITSVGSIYLGPFYYYFMAPWLGLFGLNPVGPAYGVALISVVCIALQYLAVKDLTDRSTALLSVIFTASSWVLVEYSRFSWNPNLLPPVSFFAVYALIKASQTNKLKWFALLGALLSIAIQLHYLAVFLFPVVGAVVFFDLIWSKKKLRGNILKGIVVAAVSFAIFLAPFILFEAKHGFPNMHSMLNFVNDNSSREGSDNLFGETTTTARSLFSYLTQADQETLGSVPALLLAVFFFLLVPLSLAIYKKKERFYSYPILIVSITLFTLYAGTSLYHGPKYAHYLGALYILCFVEIAFLLTRIPQSYRITAITLCMVLFLSANLTQFYHKTQGVGHRQLQRARNVATAVANMNPRAPYTFTSSPEAYADYPYRYFLEAWGRDPIRKENDSYANAKDLIVICEEQCEPMKDSQWAIAHFSPNKIADEKKADGVYIYRLTK